MHRLYYYTIVHDEYKHILHFFSLIKQACTLNYWLSNLHCKYTIIITNKYDKYNLFYSKKY